MRDEHLRDNREGLAEKAIHRKTFYLHYSSIDDLFEEMAQDSIDGYASVLMGVPRGSSPRS
jgi:AcrR family transcriptional regulator